MYLAANSANAGVSGNYMKVVLVLSIFFASTCFLSSCVNPPDTKAIGQDLGITLPEKYKLVGADSDPFGLGADANISYTFKFDSLNYAKLIKSIEGSVLFNTASEKNFDRLSVDKKRRIIETLAQNKMTSYWLKSDSDYLYDGNALIINEPDRVYKQAFSSGVLLPNQKETATFTDGTPADVYEVRAKVDRKKQTLYYNYVHI